jgi:phosphoribosylglycinamide formyltransferase 1
MKKTKLVLFASGGGSNAVKIIDHFTNHSNIEVISIFCNNPSAGILAKAKDLNIDTKLFTREEYKNGGVLKALQELDTDFIALAGFLWLVPSEIVKAFDGKILNIHPALLPNYGGKGMYGMNVHTAVFENKDKESGITIHEVNERYDEGEYVFQAKVDVSSCKSPQEIASTVLAIEHQNFPSVIEEFIQNKA